MFSVAKATLQSQMSVRLSVTKTPQPLRITPIDHQAYRPSSLLTVKPIDHQAALAILLRLLSLSACLIRFEAAKLSINS